MAELQRILRIWDVQRLTGLSRTRIYQLLHEGDFPERLELGPNSVGWLEHEVAEWIAARKYRRSLRREDLSETARP